MADNKAPVLKRFVLPSVIDIGPGPQPFRLVAEAEDGADGSGVAYVSLWLNKELDVAGASSTAMLQFGYSWSADGFGDATPATASADFTLREVTPVGDYTVESVWVTDLAGNVAKYDTQQLRAMGINTMLAVTGRAADVTAPVLTGLSLPATIDLSNGPAPLPLTVQATDGDGSGIELVTVWFYQSLATEGYRSSFLNLGNYLTDDDFRDATPNQATRVFELDPATPPGDYRVSHVTVTDRAGNTRTVQGWELEAMGASTTMKVSGGGADDTPPELLDLWLPRTVSLQSGVPQALAVSARDPGGKGVDSVIVTLDRKLALSEGLSDSLYIGRYSEGDNFLDASPQFGVDRFKLTQAATAGTYNILTVQVGDGKGNYKIYSALELQQMGINTAMTVLDRPALAAATPSAAPSGDGRFVLSLTSPDWAAKGVDAYAATFAFDPAKLRVVEASVSGAASASLPAILSGQGRVTVSGNGDLAPGATLDIVLEALDASAPVQYALESFRVNGAAQVLGAGNLDTVRAGTDGADLLRDARAGLVDGRGGLDHLAFESERAAYAVRKQGAGFVLTTPDGERISLSNVERLDFADRSVALDVNGVGGQAYRLYQAAFDRRPDEFGLGFWLKQMDAGAGLTSVARAFIQSAEFEGKYGVEPSNEAFLSALYANILHRAPDASGKAYWLEALKANFDRAEMLAAFSESAENVAQVVGSIENGFNYMG